MIHAPEVTVVQQGVVDQVYGHVVRVSVDGQHYHYFQMYRVEHGSHKVVMLHSEMGPGLNHCMSAFNAWYGVWEQMTVRDVTPLK